MHVSVNRTARRKSDKDSSSPLRYSYADMVKHRSPVAGSVTLDSVGSFQSYPDSAFPTPKRSTECSVCSEKYVSPRALCIHMRL